MNLINFQVCPFVSSAVLPRLICYVHAFNPYPLLVSFRMASNPKRDTSDPQPEAKRLCHLEEKTEKIERCLAQLVQAITARKSSTLDQSPAVSDPGMASGVSDQSPPLSSAPANPVQASAPVQAAHQPSATVQAAPGSSASVLAAPLPSSSGQPFISPPAQSAAFLAQPASTASLPPSAAHHLYPLPFFCDPSYYGHYLQSAMKASRGQVAQPPPPSESVTPIPLSPVSSDQEDFSEEDEVVDCNPPALFSFAPSTKEREPSIPDPDSELASQGVVCQKLGSPAWNRVRYTESQRALQAGGVFQPLAIPSEFPHSNSSTGENLVRQELFLGTLTHGLLLQRRAFSSTMNTLVEKYPEVREELGSLFSDESVFKNVSDHLLQYVCGKRAECLESRRRLVEPRDPHLARLVRRIPPSPSALYEEGQFSEFFHNHPSAFRRPNPRPTAPANFQQPAPSGQKRKEKQQPSKPRATRPGFSQGSNPAKTSKMLKPRKSSR
jgi:hypothetical protein